jgi:polar amino acid transport system substrate-binding protein
MPVKEEVVGTGLRSLVVALSLLASAVIAAAEPSSDPRVADIVKAGKLRVGTFPPQYTKDEKTGELKGPWVEMLRAVGTQIGVEVVVTELPTPKALVDCLASGACDLGSLGFDPTRADQVGGFTPPFIQVDYTYLVPSGSAIRNLADADRAGVRIAAVRNHASTLTLGRMVKQAELVIAETPDAAFDLLRDGRVHAWASVRPALIDYSAELPNSRVLEEAFGANFPALVVPKGQPERLAYLSEFVEQAKASGLVQKALDRTGRPGYRVAPPGNR